MSTKKKHPLLTDNSRYMREHLALLIHLERVGDQGADRFELRDAVLPSEFLYTVMSHLDTLERLDLVRVSVMPQRGRVFTLTDAGRSFIEERRA